MGKLPVEKEENVHKTVTLFTAEIVAFSAYFILLRKQNTERKVNILTVAFVSSG